MTSYPNIPLTEADRQAMLRELGVASAEALFAQIPEAIRSACRIEGGVPADGLSEAGAFGRLRELAERNRPARVGFAGAGSYDHYVPQSVDHILRRSEYLTAYTPYQPEVAQGTLQVIFEFQSLVAALTGMEVANASLYDGATGAAEAALLALAEKGTPSGGVVAVSEGVDPRIVRVLETYLRASGTGLRRVPLGSCGRTAPEPAHLAGVAAFVVASPNFFGCVEDLRALADAAHASGALLVDVAYPVALGLLEAPGRLGADVVVGDATCFGSGRNFGGPGLGIFAVNKALMRRIPGRLAGLTLDAEGRRCIVLTLQAREQHIRRAKATSNICTNQGLIALAATVHMALLGGEGLARMARACHQGAQYLRKKLAGLAGYGLVYPSPVFNEFALRCPVPASEVLAGVRARTGMVAGFDLGSVFPHRKNELLVAVTEQRTKDECDRLATALEEIL